MDKVYDLTHLNHLLTVIGKGYANQDSLRGTLRHYKKDGEPIPKISEVEWIFTFSDLIKVMQILIKRRGKNKRGH
jgi:hypothetical protein